MNHSFNIEVAVKYGMAEAVLLEYMYFWCQKNEANRKNIKDGLAWTYNSIKALCELFPYLTEKKIINTLKHLEDEGLLVSGCFNSNKYDRTKWYAVTKKGKSIYQNGQIEEAKKENENPQNGQMNVTVINQFKEPVINTHTETDDKIKNDEEENCVCERDCFSSPSSPDYLSSEESFISDAQAKYARSIFDLWDKNGLPCCNGNFLSFLQKDFRLALPELKGYHSDSVITACQNYIKVLKGDRYWVTKELTFDRFVTSKLFKGCLEENFREVNFLDDSEKTARKYGSAVSQSGCDSRHVQLF